ncbi:hypothetical protein CJF31_00001340 [Rutstroemia sp. NJR-2017a BVV2]|nr:hypothetical protein CJF31_00001340 [Rutstroemia sp. NJR-2017a BVV2]
MGRLGTSAEVVFDENCPLCCCLFMICPNPTKPVQEVLVIPSLTVWRLASRNDIDVGVDENSTKCLIVVLSPPDMQYSVKGTDALCFVQDGETTMGRSLGARIVNRNGYSMDVLKGWLERCEKLHPVTCRRHWEEDLRSIFLVNVHTRQVVRYPLSKCDYVALSYVWGQVEQPAVKTGTVLGELPQTIEDAITLVKALSMQYLWVDSLCIDQSNESYKKAQIALMCSIYEGAYATIAAVSGRSANSGLPSVSRNIEKFEQVSCTINGKSLASLMPPLGFLMPNGTWERRAWTFQEALLSARCFYFTEHQVYFECNAMTCCESLSESTSLVHNLLWNKAFIESGIPVGKYGKGILRSPFRGPSRKAIRFQEYGHLLTLYSYRQMTNDSDGINAFSGIAQAMTQDWYPKGFHWGLPIEDFNYGLVWASRSEPRRRAGFPSWSWGAWDTPRWPTVSGDIDVGQDSKLQPSLRVMHFTSGKPELLYETPNFSGVENEDKKDVTISASDETTENHASTIDLSLYPPSTYPGLIHITATILCLTIHPYIPPSSSWDEFRQTRTTLQGKDFCVDYQYSGDFLESKFGKVQDFLFVAKQLRDGFAVYYLLMLDWGEGKEVARRVAPMELWVDEWFVEVLEDTTPTRRNLLLA